MRQQMQPSYGQPCSGGYAVKLGSQTFERWVTAQVGAFKFFNGCLTLVCNSHSGVSLAHRYDPGGLCSYFWKRQLSGVCLLPRERDDSRSAIQVSGWIGQVRSCLTVCVSFFGHLCLPIATGVIGQLTQSIAERGEIFDFVAARPQNVVKIVAWWVKRGYCG